MYEYRLIYAIDGAVGRLSVDPFSELYAGEEYLTCSGSPRMYIKLQSLHTAGAPLTLSVTVHRVRKNSLPAEIS